MNPYAAGSTVTRNMVLPFVTVTLGFTMNPYAANRFAARAFSQDKLQARVGARASESDLTLARASDLFVCKEETNKIIRA